MKTRSREYSFPTVSEPSAVRTSNRSSGIIDSCYTYRSEDSDSSSVYELIVEPERKRENFSDTEEYYRDLVDKVKLMFIEKKTRDDSGREHTGPYFIEYETHPKSLEVDIMEDSDEASFSKFQDDINMSRTMFNATSTPHPASSISINELQFGNISDVSETKLDEPQLVSPENTLSNIPFNSEQNNSMIISNESCNSDSDIEEEENVRFDGNANKQSEDGICNKTLAEDESQNDDEMSSATTEVSSELIIEQFDKSDDENGNESNFNNNHQSNTDSGVEAPVKEVETILKRKSDGTDSICNATFPSSSMSISLQLCNVSGFNESEFVESPTESLENVLLDIQCRSGYNSSTIISKGNVHNMSNEMEIQKVPFTSNINTQLEEIEEHENSFVKKKTSQECHIDHVIVGEHEITSAGSEKLNEIIIEQSSNCEDLNDKEEEEAEEEITTTESEKLNERINEQSRNCEDVNEEKEEITTAESEKLNDVINEQSSNCENVKEEEEEITTTKSEELNEVITEQSSNCEDVEDSGKSGDSLNPTNKQISNSNTNVEVLNEKVKSSLKRKLDVGVQTMSPSESLCKRTKAWEHLKMNFFMGDLRVYSINKIL